MGKETPSGSVEARLDVLLRLAAMSLATGKSQQVQIWFLNKAGLAPSEIAELLGTTGNTVSVALAKLRKLAPPEIRKLVWAGRGNDKGNGGKGRGR